MNDGVDTFKQEILARLVAAETNAQQVVDEAVLQAQRTVAKATDAAAQMVEEAHTQAAADAEALIKRSAQEVDDEVVSLRAAADRRDAAMEEAAHRNLDAATTLVVGWVAGEGD